MEQELAGRVALVTGAGRGIGLATALALARRGAALALNDVNASLVDAAAASVAAMDVNVFQCPGDIADPETVRGMVDATVARFKRLDILVNNAGVGGTGQKLIELAVEEWDRIIRVDLTGTFLCCRAAAPEMIAQGGGAIVNVASVFALSGAVGSIPYSAAKAGVIGMTKSMARELAPHRIRVNSVAPGLIDTTMSRARGTMTTMRSEVLWHRVGQPEDVAELIAFLVSAGSEFITGQVISPNGGSYL